MAPLLAGDGALLAGDGAPLADDVFFQSAILSISRYSTEIKMTFLEFWDKTDLETHILFD